MAKYPAVETVYYVYDPAGSMTQMQDEWGATYWTYDVMGRPICRHDPRGTVVYYAYGDGGRRTQLTVHGQGTVYYAYDEVGGMISVLDGKTGSATYYDYDAERRVTRQQHPNATTTYFNYDLAGRLSEKVTVKDADASVLVRFAYTRDAGGNPIAIERESGLGVFYYAYDALQRLSYEGQFVSAARQYENYYEYDPAGNRTLLRHGESAAENLTYYDYDAANELTSLHDASGWTYFAYDANGNTVSEQTPSYTRYFDWDGRDMLVGVRSTEPAWTDNEYRYDGMAGRVAKCDAAGITYFAFDEVRGVRESVAGRVHAGEVPWAVLLHANGEYAVSHRNIIGHSRRRAVANMAVFDESGTLLVPCADEVGSVWALLDSEAAVVNSYSYDGFGVLRNATEALGNSYRFAGKIADFDSGALHFVARYYRPAIGIFMSRDPQLPLSGGRGHGYADGNPLGRVDPLGRTCKVFYHCDELIDQARLGCTRVCIYRCTEYKRRTAGGGTLECKDLPAVLAPNLHKVASATHTSLLCLFLRWPLNRLCGPDPCDPDTSDTHEYFRDREFDLSNCSRKRCSIWCNRAQSVLSKVCNLIPGGSTGCKAIVVEAFLVCVEACQLCPNA